MDLWTFPAIHLMLVHVLFWESYFRPLRILLLLSLEWNCIGLCSSSFSALCDALILNSTLHHLDLRSNQIGPNLIPALCSVIEKNSSLETVDLRWNCIGSIGGKSILKSLESNTSLVKLDLIGNTISNEILASIKSQIVHTIRLATSSSSHISQNELVKKELKARDAIAQHKIAELEKTASDTDKEELKSKKLELQAVQTKFDLEASALKVAKDKMIDTERNAKLQEEELKCCQVELESIKRTSREEFHGMEDRHVAEARELKNRISRLDVEKSNLEHCCSSQRNQITDLQEDIHCLQANLKAVIAEREELLTRERQKYKDSIIELEEKHHHEMMKFRDEMHDMEHHLKVAIAQKENDAVKHAAELTQLKSQLAAEQSSLSVQIKAVKQQLKKDNEIFTQGMQSKLEAAEEIRLDAENRLQKMASAHLALTKTNSNMTSQIQSLKHTIGQLQSEVDRKDSDVQATEKRTRDSFATQLEELTSLKEEAGLKQKMMVELEMRLDRLRRESESRIDDLAKRLEERDAKIAQMRLGESKRVSELQAAFVAYFGSLEK